MKELEISVGVETYTKINRGPSRSEVFGARGAAKWWKDAAKEAGWFLESVSRENRNLNNLWISESEKRRELARVNLYLAVQLEEAQKGLEQAKDKLRDAKDINGTTSMASKARAWNRIADHPALKSAIFREGTMLDGVIEILDELHERSGR